MTSSNGKQIRRGTALQILGLICGLTLISAGGLFSQDEPAQPDRQQQLEAFLTDDTRPRPSTSSPKTPISCRSVPHR